MYSTSEGDNPAPDERLTQTGESRDQCVTQVGEIEVTEEMARAGADEIWDYHSEVGLEFANYSDLAKRVYQSMSRRKLESKCRR